MPASAKKNPPPLAELQDWLRWIFTEPSGPTAALHNPIAALNSPAGPVELRRRPEPLPRLLNWIEEGAPIGAEKRLSVYSDAYFLRLLESLGSDFKTLRRVLGEDEFRGLVTRYLADHPSTSQNIGDLGEGLPDFVARDTIIERFPFATELASLEWTVLRTLFTDRLPPIDPAALQRVPAEAWSRARLILDPTVSLLELSWPVDRLWESSRLKKIPRQERRLLIYRNDEWVDVASLSAAPYRTLELIRQGRTLIDVCSEIGRLERSAGSFDFQAWFSRWIAQGVIKGALSA